MHWAALVKSSTSSCFARSYVLCTAHRRVLQAERTRLCGVGLDYLWRIVLDAPDARISDRARKSLVALHVHLAEDLQPQRTDIRQAFLQ